MISPYSFTVAYVLASDGGDAYADMALISLLSVRLTNPGLRIAVVSDKGSLSSLEGAAHPLVRECDRLVGIDTPKGERVFRSRWIKTQLCRFVDGNVLYLDADTLVRGNLKWLPNLVAEFGAVANHNGSTLDDQIWDEDLKVIRRMEWPDAFRTYVNGGVWFFRPFDRVRRLFAQWHTYWREENATAGCLRDQPPLNSAILASGARLSILPGTFNAQVAMPEGNIGSALIWHFYASAEWDQGALGWLLRSAKSDGIEDLRLRVAEAIRQAEPWVASGGPVSTDADGRIAAPGRTSVLSALHPI